MISEQIPSPALRLERQSRCTLEGFLPMDKKDLEDLIPEAKAELDADGIPMYEDADETDYSVELLSRTDPDGVLLALATITFKQDKMLSGAIVQVSGDKMIGRTSFASELYSGEEIIYICKTDTFGQEREGLAEQRMRIINEYTKCRYGKALCSLTGRSNQAQGLWESLLKRGLAEHRKLKDGGMVYSLL